MPIGAAPGRSNNPYRQAMRGLRRTLIQAGLFSAAMNILMLTGPIYMLQVYDRVLSSSSVATLQGLFIIVVVLYGFLGLYDFLRARLLSRAAYRLDTLTGAAAFDTWLRSGIGNDGPAENPLRDLEIVRGFLASPAIAGLFDVPSIPFFLAIVFFLHAWLGWLTVAGAVVIAGAAILNKTMTQDSISDAMAMEAAERNFVEKSRRNAEAVTALGMGLKVTRRWQDIHHAALARMQQGGDRGEAFSAFSKSFRLLLQSMLLTVGAYLAIRQEVTPGAIVATSIIAGRALAPVDQVIGQWRMIGRAREAHHRIIATFDRRPAEPRRLSLPAPQGHLRIIGLTKLLPPPLQTPERSRILDRISFELAPGDALCVIGNSAAGKSSLAKILVGAWQPDAGEVRLDGARLFQWPPEELGRHIGYLPQSIEMMPGTIADNIARFDRTARDQDVVAAAQLAGVHEMILKLPKGYTTLIGSAEQPLSGGQIQRLGLARALYGNPRLVVLDEPNSNLDAQGDEALSSALQALRARDAVVVVMAHRPNVIKVVNKVMILHKGVNAHFGDQEEVIRMAVRGVPGPVPVRSTGRTG
jgi:ATP-binding cassette, subfamily C, type I secretion system permease/ATPase